MRLCRRMSVSIARLSPERMRPTRSMSDGFLVTATLLSCIFPPLTEHALAKVDIRHMRLMHGAQRRPCIWLRNTRHGLGNALGDPRLSAVQQVEPLAPLAPPQAA